MQLPYDTLPGAVGARALKEHLLLLDGYRKLGESSARQRREHRHHVKALNLADPYRAAVLAQNVADAAVLLHETYFASFIPGGAPLRPAGRALRGDPPSTGFLRAAILPRDHEKVPVMLLDELRAVAMSVRGWAVLVCTPDTGRLRIVGMDDHDRGTFEEVPIVAVDMFEHAYWMDWGTNRAGYLDALLPQIDWIAASERYDQALRD